MISPRYAFVTAILLAVALIPTTIHTYVGSVVTDSLVTSAIPETLDGMVGAPTDRRPGWVRNNLESDDWIERSYSAGGQDVKLFVGRSYDAKRLYHHPELALLRGTETEPVGTARLDSRPNLPLHVIRTSHEGRRGVAVYALLYQQRFIESPVLFQLRTSAELLVSGRRPMTLFMASDLSGRPDRLADAPATKVLLAAIDAFLAQGPPNTRE